MIDIIMATYNGEHFLKQQVFSIISQTYKDWKLWIYDDGSTDNTISIIKELEQIDERICLVEVNKTGKSLGCAANFLNGIKKSTADYIMLCDQDDMWFDKKIEVMFDKIKKNESQILNTQPLLILSQGFNYINKSGEIAGINNQLQPKSLKSFLFLNGGLQGCSMLFNYHLKEKLYELDVDVAMHDHLISLIAFSMGKVDYIKRPLMLYRKHDNNVTTTVTGSFFKKIYSHLVNRKPLIDKCHFLATKSFYLNINEKLSTETSKTFNDYFDTLNRPFFYNVYFILIDRINYSGSRLVLLYKLFISKKMISNISTDLVRWSGK